MNYIKHLNNFFTLMEYDNRLTASHVSLYMALFRYWNFNRFKNPFPVYRENMMRSSKIGSKNTYHRCIKELHDARYIYYHPAPSRYKPANVSILAIEIKEEKDPTQLKLFTASGKPAVSTKTETYISPNNEPYTGIKTETHVSTDSGTQHVSEMGHYIKHINNINSECKHTHEVFRKEGKGSQRPKNSPARVPVLGHINDPPALKDVEDFFRENKYPETEAKKFFYFNQGKNWMLQKDTPITDWKSVAHKWMLNDRSGAAGAVGVVGKLVKGSGVAKDLKQIYQMFVQGEPVTKLILPEHFDQAGLQLTEVGLQQAWKQRIGQLTGSNEYSESQLLQAYQREDADNELVLRDRPNLISLAKRIAVLEYFRHLKLQDT